MKVSLVSEHASPLALLGSVDAGGQNVHVDQLARALGRLGDRVVVHTRRDDPGLAPRVELGHGVTVEHVDAGPPEPIAKDDLLPFMDRFGEQLWRRWRTDRPDVVHSHFWMSGLASLEATRRLELPLAHTYHALGVVKRRHQGERDTSPSRRIEVERRLAREADLVVATTHAEVEELVTQGGDASRMTVIPCGVDLSSFAPTGPVAARTPGRRRVVVVSRLVERKGIGNVITALARLPRDVELIVVGGPPAGLITDDDEALRFLELVDELGLADRVELRGAVTRDDVPELLRSADAVACCPWYEPFGLVAVEAMACGVPVVASAVGGLAETVVDGVSGLLVPPRSPEAIAEALRALLGDDRRRRRLGQGAVRRSRVYGWPDVASRTHAALAQLSTTSRLRVDRTAS